MFDRGLGFPEQARGEGEKRGGGSEGSVRKLNDGGVVTGKGRWTEREIEENAIANPSRAIGLTTRQGQARLGSSLIAD